MPATPGPRTPTQITPTSEPVNLVMDKIYRLPVEEKQERKDRAQKILDGVKYMPAGHARPGGEVGRNKEFYKGGQFLPSSDMPKKERVKLERAASGKEQVEYGGYSKDDYAVPEPYMAPLLRHYKTFMNDEFMNYQLRNNFFTVEDVSRMKQYRRKFEDGERWVDIRKDPDMANVNDVARLFKAKLPISEAILNNIPPDRADLIRKYSKKSDE